MIPLKDNIPSRRFPLTNIALIILNFLIFFWEISLPPSYREYIFWKFGFIPQRLEFLSFFSSLFLHGGWAHILGNMLFLWIFGDNVEDSMGHLRYLFFYLLAGVVANIVQGFLSLNKLIPTIGASGAIAGVLGAYFVYFPRARIITLAFLGFFVDIIYIPAGFFLLFWFISQFLFGISSLAFEITGGVAWWAHIGGFLFGFFIAPFLRKYKRYYYYF